MFGFLEDIAKGIGAIVGTIVGIPVGVIAETLNITTSMAKEAVDAGCTSYEEVKKFHNL